jgi:hypothetical protein
MGNRNRKSFRFVGTAGAVSPICSNVDVIPRALHQLGCFLTN